MPETSTTLQPFGIHVPPQILQHHADQQERVYIAYRVKLNVTAKEKYYSSMWTKVEFRSIW